MHQSNVRQSVELFIEQHKRDGLLYMDCPVCNRSNKLMIGEADEGGHWWKCLAAGCATFGTTTRSTYSTTSSARRGGGDAGTRTYPRYQYHVKYSPGSREGRWAPYGISGVQADMLCAGKVDMYYVLPIWAPNGEQRGYVLRSYQEGKFKALTRPYDTGKDEPLISWYISVTCKQSPVICVVEDQVSAARLSKYFPTVALLGTSAGPDTVLELTNMRRKLNARWIAVILDQDAQMQALKLSVSIPYARPVPMFEEDVKDLSEEGMKQLVEVLNG